MFKFASSRSQTPSTLRWSETSYSKGRVRRPSKVDAHAGNIQTAPRRPLVVGHEHLGVGLVEHPQVQLELVVGRGQAEAVAQPPDQEPVGPLAGVDVEVPPGAAPATRLAPLQFQASGGA